jgi:hypothetical protein
MQNFWPINTRVAQITEPTLRALATIHRLMDRGEHATNIQLTKMPIDECCECVAYSSRQKKPSNNACTLGMGGPAAKCLSIACVCLYFGER